MAGNDASPCGGRGFGPPGSSAPTEGLPKSRQRADVPKAWLPPTKFRAEIWGVSHGHRPLRPAGDEGRGMARRGRRALRGCGTGPMYLGHGLRRPNSVPKFGASVRSSAPTESPSQPTRSEASAPAVTRSKRESAQRPSKRGSPPATTQAALSEAESAERAAGQIRSLPDDIRVQHGVQRLEVSAKPRPCSRRGCGN